MPGISRQVLEDGLEVLLLGSLKATRYRGRTRVADPRHQTILDVSGEGTREDQLVQTGCSFGNHRLRVTEKLLDVAGLSLCDFLNTRLAL